MKRYLDVSAAPVWLDRYNLRFDTQVFAQQYRPHLSYPYADMQALRSKSLAWTGSMQAVIGEYGNIDRIPKEGRIDRNCLMETTLTFIVNRRLPGGKCIPNLFVGRYRHHMLSQSRRLKSP